MNFQKFDIADLLLKNALELKPNDKQILQVINKLNQLKSNINPNIEK